MTEQIAFYGKGGVGKSTLIANISAALVEAGFRVMQVGCDPKGGSCSILNGGLAIPSIAEQRHNDGSLLFDRIISRGFKGIYCVELGASESGVGDITESVRAIELLGRHGIITALAPDFVLYDVSDERGASAFHQALQALGLNRVFVITTADFSSLGATNAIISALGCMEEQDAPVPFGGLIPNIITSSFDESFIVDFAKQTGAGTLARIPRSQLVRQCELYGKTVIEASPLSNQSYFYRRLANQIVDESQDSTKRHRPSPLPADKLRAWGREWADRLFAMENGLVTDGAAI